MVLKRVQYSINMSFKIGPLKLNCNFRSITLPKFFKIRIDNQRAEVVAFFKSSLTFLLKIHFKNSKEALHNLYWKYIYEYIYMSLSKSLKMCFEIHVYKATEVLQNWYLQSTTISSIVLQNFYWKSTSIRRLWGFLCLLKLVLKILIYNVTKAHQNWYWNSTSIRLQNP